MGGPVQNHLAMRAHVIGRKTGDSQSSRANFAYNPPREDAASRSAFYALLTPALKAQTWRRMHPALNRTIRRMAILLHTSTHCFCRNRASPLKNAKSDAKSRLRRAGDSGGSRL